MTTFTWQALRRCGSPDRSPGHRPRRRAGRLARDAAGVPAAAGLAAPAAIAGPRSLVYAGCIGDHPGCTPITPGATAALTLLAVTTDGAHLYAAADAGHAVSHFLIDPGREPDLRRLPPPRAGRSHQRPGRDAGRRVPVPGIQ